MDYDLIVIGGGINGCGIARDASMRGLKTLLIEKHDFAFAASGNNSQMIHGGSRYLLYDRPVTKHSCVDSAYIQKIAPHLIFRIPFIYPILRNGNSKFLKMKLEATEAFFRAYDKYNVIKNGRPHLRLSPEEALAIEPDLNPNMIGAVTFDEYGIDSPRLTLANALAAQEHGADVRNYCELEDLIVEHASVRGVKIKDLITGIREQYTAKMIVNATGAWSPQLGKKAGVEIKVRPTKGIHISFEGRFSDLAILCDGIDGRPFFTMPHQNTTILGTTDDDYFGNLDEVPILEDEVEYLLEGIEQVFPKIRQARMIRAWVGVRPTLYERGKYESDLSREHDIIDHEIRDQVGGLISVIGGKLASYRILSEEVTDLVCDKLDRPEKCETHLEVLPGGEAELDVQDLAREFRIDVLAAERLIYRHGSRARKVLSILNQKKSLGNMICTCEPVLEAEIRYVVRHEFCKTLDDLRRRTRLSLGSCQGADCIRAAAQIMAEELKWDVLRTYQEINNFLELKWKSQIHILESSHIANEELKSMIHYNQNSLDKV